MQVQCGKGGTLLEESHETTEFTPEVQRCPSSRKQGVRGTCCIRRYYLFILLLQKATVAKLLEHPGTPVREDWRFNTITVGPSVDVNQDNILQNGTCIL